MRDASSLADPALSGDRSLGAQLAARMMASFVIDGNGPDNDLFATIAESAFHKFEGAEETGVISAENFASLTNAFVMDRLRAGSNLPRLPGIMPAFLLTRLPYWTPYAIWVSYLVGQELKPMTLIENAPVVAEHPEFGPTAFHRVEFRVYPYLRALAS